MPHHLRRENGRNVKVYNVLPNNNKDFNNQLINGCNPIYLSKKDFAEVTGKEDVTRRTFSIFWYVTENKKGEKVPVRTIDCRGHDDNWSAEKIKIKAIKVDDTYSPFRRNG